jgi:competence protein ComEA
MSTPTTQPAPIQNSGADRTASFNLGVAFVLGMAAALIGVRLYEGRQTRPLDRQLGDHYRIDLNRASTQELQQLPRMSPATAERVVAARPIDSVDDLRRVGGLGPKSIEKLKPFVTSNGSSESWPVKPLARELVDPNNATAEQLQSLPGIGPKLAQRIMDERQKRPFATVDDLRRVAGIGPKTIDKLRPLVDVRPTPSFDQN